MNQEQFAKLFPWGSHLCREPMPPMSELKSDMEILKGHGFNLIKLQEHWMIDEPAEGKYDFSRYEELIEHAGSLDLGIYLGFTCEQAPHWLYEKYPDCRMERRNGTAMMYEATTTLPADGKPGPCFDHGGAMADQLRFIARAVEVLGSFENVVVWNTWQEISYWAEMFAGGHVCYCPNTVVAYQEWLESKYGDLDLLNRSWNSRYAAWGDIQPERGSGTMVCAQEVEWRYFMDNVQIANVLKQRAAAIKAADPLKRPVFAHKGYPSLGGAQDWTYARCQEFVGSSCYPAWSALDKWDDDFGVQPIKKHTALTAEMWDGVVYRFDYIRSCNREGAPIWAAEFQGGPISTGFHKGRVPDAADIRRWTLSALGTGVSALSFWVTRAEIAGSEVNGFSLLDSAGDATARLDEAGRIGQALNQYADLFGEPTRPRAEVAILVGEENAQVCNAMSQGGENLQYAVRGWHRLLWDAGVPVDFVAVSELAKSYVGDYKVMVVPFMLAMSEDTAGKLCSYVNGGGNVICEAAVGRFNECGFSNRGELSPGAAELFGVQQESFMMVREPDEGRRWSPDERTWGEYLGASMLQGKGLLDGHQLRANVYVETYVPVDAEVLLKDGDTVAGTVRQVGEGRAILLGTFVGHSGTAYCNSETAECVDALMEQLGIEPQNVGDLLCQKRVLPDREAWILTNPTEESITESIDVSGWSSVEDLLANDPPRSGDVVAVTVDSLDVRVLILGR